MTLNQFYDGAKNLYNQKITATNSIKNQNL